MKNRVTYKATHPSKDQTYCTVTLTLTDGTRQNELMQASIKKALKTCYTNIVQDGELIIKDGFTIDPQ